MATTKLGKLQEVNIRKLWNHEQHDFSEWLTKPESDTGVLKCLIEKKAA